MNRESLFGFFANFACLPFSTNLLSDRGLKKQPDSMHIWRYIEIWASKVGDDSFYLRCDDGNERDKNSMAVMIGGQIGGHISNNLSKIFKLFLTLPNCFIKCKVIESV